MVANTSCCDCSEMRVASYKAHVSHHPHRFIASQIANCKSTTATFTTSIPHATSAMPHHYHRHQLWRNNVVKPSTLITCSSSSSNNTSSTLENQNLTALLKGKRILIIGGTGRVGAAAAAVITRALPAVTVILASRRKESFNEAVLRNPELKGTEFMSVDIANKDSIEVWSSVRI